MAAKSTRLVREVLEERGRVYHEEQTIKKNNNFTHPLFCSLTLFLKEEKKNWTKVHILLIDKPEG